MARKTDKNGDRILIYECPKHGEFYADDTITSECPSCQDEELETSPPKPATLEE